MPVMDDRESTFDVLVGETVWPTAGKSAPWRKLISEANGVYVHKGWSPTKLHKASSVFLVSNTAGFSDSTSISSLQDIPAARKRYLLWVDDEADGLAEVMPRLHIRNENRIHLITKGRQPDFSKPLIRLVRMLKRKAEGESIFDAYWKGEVLVVTSPFFERLHVPLDTIPKIRRASQTDRERFVIDEFGDHVYWPSHDVHMGWGQFLQVVDPQSKLRAEQRSEQFNRVYGAAIREFREQTKLRQSDIDGINERTVRRIENGKTRATATAIAALAKAHHMLPKDYMDRLADLTGDSDMH